MIFRGIKNAEKREKERNVYKILHRDGREGGNKSKGGRE